MNDLKRLAQELGSGLKGDALRQLGSSSDGKKLESLVDGAALEKALAAGDSAALQRMLASLLATPEGKRLAEDVGSIMRA